jgi:hypothetical protein
MMKGSVVVNGVRFDDSGADISIDGTPKTATDLHGGPGRRRQRCHSG